MENSNGPEEHGTSYELPERGPSNDLPSIESAQVNSSNNLPLNVASVDLVRRRLKERHVQMIAIAGTLGTGLFLGSGEAISEAGPLGALMAFALVGSVAYASLCSLGEMTSLAPISGTFPHFASRWVDPALGFAVGWNYFLTNAFFVPTEISGARLLITMWDEGHAWLYTLVICLVVCATNLFGVVYFAETEFAFSIIKLIMITGLIIVGLLIDLGALPNQSPIGFNYWKDTGAFVAHNSTSALEPQDPSLDNFIGILSAIVLAAFSYQGIEIVAVAASETLNPRRNITKAIRRVFYRILIFYIIGVFVAGLIVPSTSIDLLTVSNSTGTATQSPFVIAINKANIKALPSIVTAGMITSAFSAGNSFLFCSSRILYGLAIRKQAPSIFAYCTTKGLPIVAVLCSSAFAFLSLINIKSQSEGVFNKLMKLCTIGGFLGWFSINLTYLFFYRGLRVQGIDRRNLHYWNSLQPWLSFWGLFWCTFFILINGFRVFYGRFDTGEFFTAYADILIFLALFLFWKITRRSVIWKPDEMDFATGIPTYKATEGPEIPPKGFWERVAAALF